MNTIPSVWWEAPEGHAHETVIPFVERLDLAQSYRHKENLRYLRIYNNQDSLGIANNFLYQLSGPANADVRVTFNVTLAVVDTVTNKIAKQRPKPTFITERGNWSVKRKAQQLDQFCVGLAHTTKLYEEGQKTFRHACTFGTGALKIFREGNLIRCENVFIDELRIDEVEGVYGKPRQIHQCKTVSKRVLAAAYPDHAEKIMACSPPTELKGRADSASEQVLVTESWHLRSGKKAKDGKHTICIQNATLFEENYDKDYFPFVFFRWKDRLVGFYGLGLSEELFGIQREINRLLDTVRKVYKRVVLPRVFMDYAGKTPTAQVNDEIGSVVKTNGASVTIHTPDGLPAEFYAHLERLYNRAFELAGVSALAATARKPDGLDSGKAIREFSDIESERFVTVGQAYEAFYMEAYRQMLDLAKEIRDFEVSSVSKRFIKRIKWADVNLADDQFVMQVFPSSMLSQTPSGRLADVNELVAGGYLSKEWATKLLDMPDLEGYNTYATAAIDNIERQIEKCLDEGKMDPPDRFQGLDIGIDMVRASILRAWDEEVPEDKIEIMRQWVDRAVALKTAAMPMPAPAPGMVTPPPGVPAVGQPPLVPPAAA